MIATMTTPTSEETENLPIRRIIKTILAAKALGQFHDKWSSLALYLDTPDDRIKRIRDDRLVNKITLTDALHEIIEEWHTRCASAATLDKLIRAFEDLDLNSVGETLRLEFNLPCKGSESPSLCWDDIGSKFQEKVESSLETFYPSIKFDYEAKSKFAREELIDLMTGKKPSPIKNIIPEVLKYYVKRTLITRNRLTEKIFEPSSDTFLFTGIEISVLSRLVISNCKSGNVQRTDTTANQLNNRDPVVKYMMLDMPNHFTKIQSTSGSSVHHIKYEEEKFYWVKSTGSLDSLRRFIDKSQIHRSESDFLERICSSPVTESNLPVCISDSPGMGKSEILKRIATTLTNAQPERITIFLEFPKFIADIKRLNKVNSNLNLCIRKALEEMTCYSELGKSVLQSTLNSETVKIELLLDGYDELSVALVKTANAILEEIHSASKSIRLWVTTRPHLLRNLENMFTVLGYTIQSFTAEDQVAFLTSYWLRDKELPVARLTEYATNCLKQLKSTLSAKEEDIAGIPLQCLMIGEVYEEEATDFSQNDVVFSGIKIRVTSITDLYQLTIERKLKKYQSTYGKFKLNDQELIDMHVQLGLKLIFKDYFKKVEPEFRKIEKEDILNVGILQSKGSELKFIHRTFAEYFVSWFFVNIMLHGKYLQNDFDDGNNDNFEDLRALDVLKCKQARNTNEFKYPVICFFINSLLAGTKVETNTSQAFVKLFEGGQEINKLARACVNSDFINIFNLFDRFNAFAKIEKEIFDEDLTLAAISKTSVDFIKIATSRHERVHKLDDNFQTKALRAAAERGEFTTLVFLLDEKKLRTLIEDKENWKGMQLLHCCVENTKECSQEIILQKIQVIQLLVQTNHFLLQEKDNKRRTPLVCPNVHVWLLVKLIELGSNVFAKNEKSEMILNFFKYYTPEEYCSLVTSVRKENMDMLINLRNRNNNNPLLQLIETVDPEEKTLNVFKDAKADFNIRDRFSFSLLATAVKNGRSVTTLKRLIHHGSDITWRGKDNCNLLHVASKYGNLSALAFLREYNVDINAPDENLDTPLHTGAERKEFADCLKIIKTLIECRGNATAQNKTGNTFLHELLYSHENITAAQFHDMVELLIQLNHLHVLQVDNNLGISSLVLALATVDVDEKTLSLLYQHNTNLLKTTTGICKDYSGKRRLINHLPFDINILYKTDVTLLHVASIYRNYKVIPFLVQIGLNVNGKDSSKLMPLHYSCDYNSINNSESRLNTIKVLIESGADVHATVNDGDTFLHVLLRKYDALTSDQFHELTEYLVNINHTELFNIHGKNGATPLHLAAEMNNVTDETISFLGMSGVKFDSVDNNGDSVLMYAIRKNKSRDILENLIRCGANPKQTNKNGENLLHIAAQYDTIQVVEFIISLGIDVNGIDTNGDTPLLSFVRFPSIWGWKQNSLNITKLLIENGASVTKLNKQSHSPFSLAKQKFSDYAELLDILSNRFAQEINNQDENRDTQLHTAVSSNNFKLVNELVEMGAKVNLQNKRLETPLHIASLINDKSDAMKIIKLLIDRKSDPFMKDENDCTFLHILLAADTNLSPCQFHDLAEYLIGKGHVRSLETAGWNNGTASIHLALFNLDVEGRTLTLLSSHVDWNLADNIGRTPLHYTISRKCNAALLSQLVQLGADYECRDMTGNNVLHFAALYGNVYALKYFISLGLNVNDPNSYGNTPLHAIVLQDRENVPDMVRVLVDTGADSNVRNKEGETPLVILATKRTARRQIRILIHDGPSTRQIDDISTNQPLDLSKK